MWMLDKLHEEIKQAIENEFSVKFNIANEAEIRKEDRLIRINVYKTVHIVFTGIHIDIEFMDLNSEMDEKEAETWREQRKQDKRMQICEYTVSVMWVPLRREGKIRRGFWITTPIELSEEEDEKRKKIEKILRIIHCLEVMNISI